MAALARAVFCVLALGSTSETLPEGNAYVRSLLDKQRRAEETLDRYTYDVLAVKEDLDAAGEVKRMESRQFETFHVKGRRVRRLVAENGRPLPPSRQAREDHLVREQVEAVRQGKVVTERAAVRLSQVIERYDFRTVGREVVDGRPALVFEFSARPGAGGAEGDDLLRRLTGRLWVDEAEREIVRVEMRNLGTIRVGGGMGATLSSVSSRIAFRKVADAVWLPSEEETLATGRVLLFKGFRTRLRRTYSGYREFSVDIREDTRPAPPSPTPSPAF